MTTGISYPVALPYFLADGHNREPQPVADRVEMEVGVARMRRQFTLAPQFANASTWLKQAEYDAWHDFYEHDLLAGARSFHARIAGPSYISGIEWWEVRVGPPKVVFKNGGRYLVAMRMRLLAGPYETRPAPGGLEAEAGIALDADADITVLKGLGAEASIDITADANLTPIPQALAAEATIDMTADAEVGIGAELAAEATIDLDADADLTVIAGGTTDADLARVWSGLNYTLASVSDTDDALAAEWMGL